MHIARFIVVYLVALPFVAITISCKKAEPPTYPQGIQYCIDHPNEHVVELPTGSTTFTSWKKDCIVGYQLPSFTATSMDGSIISDESLLGKVSIINFWFETCPPCLAEMPGLNQVKEKYETADVNYIAIGRDYKEDIEAFLRRQTLHFTHIPDAGSLISDTFTYK